MSKVLLLCAVLGFGCGNKEREKQLRDAVEAKEQAERAASLAIRDANKALEVVERLQHDTEEMGKRLDAAIEAVAAAQSDADRAAAKTKLDQLQKEKRLLDENLRKSRVLWDATDCFNNPVAKGCN